MNRTSLKRITLLLALLASTGVLVGCRRNQDITQAKSAADRFHAHLRLAEFAAIYAESAPRFKTVGSESQFVLQMKKFHETFGSLKNADEIGYETGFDSTVGRTQVLLYKLEYEHGNASERLTLVRSPAGEMQLWKMDLQPAD